MGIQLKPAANICFDAAAAAAGQADSGGSSAGRGPGARVNHAAGMLGGAGRWDPRRRRRAGSLLQPRRAGAGPAARAAPALPAGARANCAGPPAPRPFDPEPGALLGARSPGLEVGARGREGWV